MKKIISVLILLVVANIAFAQPPHGLNYQAVALGAGGQPLSNRNISLRLSVLDSSATGTAVYVETQSVTTDTFGLFSVVIGGGAAVTGTFGGISWGHNNKWLKTEMDTAGGSNFALIGVTQFMSVPYAMYAGQSKPSFASIEYPDGLQNASTVVFSGSSYTPPAGKNLYVNPVNGFLVITPNDTLKWVNGNIAGTNTTIVGVSEGDTISYVGAGYVGTLVDKKVQWITRDLVAAPFTVPAGKNLMLVLSNVQYVNSGGYRPNATELLNGSATYISPYTIITSGNVLSATALGAGGYFIINGYLIDQQ